MDDSREAQRLIPSAAHRVEDTRRHATEPRTAPGPGPHHAEKIHTQLKRGAAAHPRQHVQRDRMKPLGATRSQHRVAHRHGHQCSDQQRPWITSPRVGHPQITELLARLRLLIAATRRLLLPRHVQSARAHHTMAAMTEASHRAGNAHHPVMSSASRLLPFLQIIQIAARPQIQTLRLNTHPPHHRLQARHPQPTIARVAHQPHPQVPRPPYTVVATPAAATAASEAIAAAAAAHLATSHHATTRPHAAAAEVQDGAQRPPDPAWVAAAHPLAAPTPTQHEIHTLHAMPTNRGPHRLHAAATPTTADTADTAATPTAAAPTAPPQPTHAHSAST